MELHRAWDLLVLLAIALGCLFFLFELFVGLTSSGGNGLSEEMSSLGPSFEVPSGGFSDDHARGDHVHCAWSRSSTGLVAMAEGPAGNATLGHEYVAARQRWRYWVLGLTCLFRGGCTEAFPTGSVPYMNYDVNIGGMEPLELIVLATIVLAVMLVGVTKPRLLILLLALCLVAVLLFWLFSSSAIPGPSLFGQSFTIATGGRLHRAS